MEAFKIALFNELEKVYRKKTAFVAVVLTLLSVIICQLGVYWMRVGWGILGASSVEFPLMMLSFSIGSILPLFTLLLISDMFCSENSNLSIKNALLRPVSRGKLYTAKITTAILFVVFILILFLVFSLLSSIIFNTESVDLEDFFNLLLAYMVSIVPLTILILAIVFVANLFKKGVTVFFVCILAYLTMKTIMIVFSEYAGLFFLSYMDWYILFLGSEWPTMTIIRFFILMVGFGMMLFSAGFHMFDKKEY